MFFDTVDPLPKPDEFPSSPTLAWPIAPAFASGSFPGMERMFELTLPIAAPPRQIATIVSAGYALSPFVAAADYSSTSARSLWLEFDRPPEDPQDSFFARVLHYGVDPLLALTPAAVSAASSRGRQRRRCKQSGSPGRRSGRGRRRGDG